jgi:uncharacterized protein (DUF433 family)
VSLAALSVCEDDVHKNKPVRRPDEPLREFPTYTLAEAAASLALSERTLFDWYAGANPVLKPSALVKGNILLSFRDLEEAYKIYILRTKHDLSLQYLRIAMTDLRNEYNTEHPLLDSGKDLAVFGKLVRNIPGSGRRPRRSVAVGSPETSTFIPEVVKTWGKRIVSIQGRDQIFPWRYFETDKESRPVSIDPEVMSGRLVLTGTRIPVVVLWGRLKAGETIEAIARDYHLAPKQVRQALIHIDKTLEKVA